MTWLSTILAATGALPAPKSTFAEILPVLLSLAGVVFVGFIALSVVRRWMRGKSASPSRDSHSRTCAASTARASSAPRSCNEPRAR